MLGNTASVLLLTDCNCQLHAKLHRHHNQPCQAQLQQGQRHTLTDKSAAAAAGRSVQQTHAHTRAHKHFKEHVAGVSSCSPGNNASLISKHAMHILLPAKHAAAAKPHQLHRHWCATRPSFVPIAVTPCCDQKPMVATAASRTSAQHCAGMPQQHIRSQGPGVISWDQKRPVAKDTACTNVKICSTLYMSE